MGSISFRDPVKHSVKDLRRRALQQKVTAKSRWLNIEADGLRIDTKFWRQILPHQRGCLV